MNNCEAISAIRYLPDILELMKVFSDKFHSRYKRDGASRLQIGQFIFRYQADVPNIKQLVESFISAWNIMLAVKGRFHFIFSMRISDFLKRPHPDRLNLVSALKV